MAEQMSRHDIWYLVKSPHCKIAPVNIAHTFNKITPIQNLPNIKKKIIVIIITIVIGFDNDILTRNN